MAAAGSSAGPARRALGGGGESGRPLRPAAAARNLQEAARPGAGGEGSRWTLGSGADGNQGSLGRQRREGRQGGGEGRTASSGASRPPLRSGPRVTAGAGSLFSRFPQRTVWRRLAGPERRREQRRWRDFALRSERRADLYPAWERVRAPPGDCSVWRAKLRDGPIGRGASEHSSEIRRGGGGGRGQRLLHQPPACPPAVPPLNPACPRPAEPWRSRAYPLWSRVSFQPPAPLCSQVLLPPHRPPAHCGGLDGLCLSGPGAAGAKLGKSALGQQCPKIPMCRAGNKLGSITHLSLISHLD